MTADEVREALRQKLRDRWSEYSAGMLQRPSTEIFERADESSISYPMEYLEYLLRFEDPLSVVQAQWISAQNVDYSDEFEHALWTIQNTQNAEQDYPLDPEWKPEQTDPSMC